MLAIVILHFSDPAALGGREAPVAWNQTRNLANAAVRRKEDSRRAASLRGRFENRPCGTPNAAARPRKRERRRLGNFRPISTKTDKFTAFSDKLTAVSRPFFHPFDAPAPSPNHPASLPSCRLPRARGASRTSPTYPLRPRPRSRKCGQVRANARDFRKNGPRRASEP